MEELRNNIVNLLSQKLNDKITNHNHVAILLEQGIFNKSMSVVNNTKQQDKEFIKNYKSNARRISANISYTPNSKDVITKLTNGQFKPEQLAYLTECHQNLHLI